MFSLPLEKCLGFPTSFPLEAGVFTIAGCDPITLINLATATLSTFPNIVKNLKKALEGSFRKML